MRCWMAKEGENVGMLEVLVMWSENKAALIIKGGRQLQSLMMASFTR